MAGSQQPRQHPGDAGFAFGHLRGEPGLVQRPGEGQGGQPSRNDQDPVVRHSTALHPA
jgi:hypothetical protein